MPINSQLLGNVNPQRTKQPRKGRMDSDSVGLAGVASGRDGGISNWTQSFGEDRNSRSLDSFTARATFQNISRCGLVLQFLQGIIMSPKISPACIHYLHLVLMTSTWIFIQIMTSRYDYALQCSGFLSDRKNLTHWNFWNLACLCICTGMHRTGTIITYNYTIRKSTIHVCTQYVSCVLQICRKYRTHFQNMNFTIKLLKV